MSRFERACCLAALLLLGCGGAPSPRTVRSPLDLSGVRPPPVVQRLRVVALADARYRTIPQYAQRIADRLDATSDHLAARFGLPLDVVRIEPWNPPEATTDAERLLADVEAQNPAPEADLVIAFTAAPPPDRPTMDDLARSRYAGRIVLARSLTALYEPGDTEGLHAAEVRGLLRAIGLVFGALPTCGNSIMGEALLPGRTPGADGWADLSLALVRTHASLDLRARGAGIPRDMAVRARDLISTAPADLRRCAGAQLTARLELLEGLARGPATAPASAPSPPTADDTAVAEGRAALEHKRFDEAFSRCGPVADRHPEGDAALCAGQAAIELNRPADAVRYLRAHLATHPGDGQTAVTLARVIGRQGDDGAARALLAAFVATHPNDLHARLNLGVAHARLGEVEAARSAWEAVLQVDPDNADAKNLLKRLERASPAPR